jgi:hypothetical protein
MNTLGPKFREGDLQNLLASTYHKLWSYLEFGQASIKMPLKPNFVEHMKKIEAEILKVSGSSPNYPPSVTKN